MGVLTSLAAITPAAASQTQGETSPNADDLTGNYKLVLLKLTEAKILLTRVQAIMAAAADANAAAVNTQLTNLS